MRSRSTPVINLDHMMYLVVVDHRDGPYIPETSLDRTSVVTVTKDLLQGQYSDVLAVIELNPVEHTSRECTDDFRAAIDRDGED